MSCQKAPALLPRQPLFSFQPFFWLLSGVGGALTLRCTALKKSWFLVYL